MYVVEIREGTPEERLYGPFENHLEAESWAREAWSDQGIEWRVRFVHVP